MFAEYLGLEIRDHYDVNTREWTKVKTERKLVEDGKGGLWVVFRPIEPEDKP